MTTVDCRREDEVMRVVAAGEWPALADAELQAHVRSCDVCRDLALVSTLLRESDAATVGEARVPAAGQLWWRAAVRMRLEAAEAAARPIVWLQGMAAAALVGAAIALAGLLWPSMREAAGAVEVFAASIAPAGGLAATLGTLLQRYLIVFVAGAACLVLVPVAFYLALSDE